jgi:dTDP-glucose 4,6-dehydratase
MSKKNILVTGGAGFIGSNFIINYLKNNSDVNIINADALTYAGNLENLKSISSDTRYIFEKIDIAEAEAVNKLFEKYKFYGVYHFAAESHVDNSITGPAQFIYTNIVGTFNLIDAARKLWMKEPFVTNPEYLDARFLHVSTDEVYGTLGETGLFSEDNRYEPNSPYSASKASSDMLVRSYFHTYGMNLVTTNCSNNYGPHQHDEKLIPTIIRKALRGEKIPVYGDGKNIRDWLYVLDHCIGIELAFKKGKSGETYNIGGRNEKTNLEVVHSICAILDQIKPKPFPHSELISFVKDRPGHDRRYAIDATKIETDLGWKAIENFQTGIEKTVKWYIGKFSE